MRRESRPFTALVPALVVVSLLSAPTAAQRRTPSVPIPRARALFAELESAWRELAALDVQPDDASHAIASWDRAWNGRLSRLERATLQACEELTPASDCAAHERTALLCGLAGQVRARRSSLLDAEQGVVGHSASEPDPLEARLAIANEASRRSAEQISCANLPSPLEIEGDRTAGWRFHDGRPLATPPDPSAPPQGLSRQQIMESIGHQRAGLDACWHAELARAPSDTRLRIELTITASGEVSAATVTGADVVSLSECIERTARAWRFEAAPAESHTTFSVVLRTDL